MKFVLYPKLPTVSTLKANYYSKVVENFKYLPNPGESRPVYEQPISITICTFEFTLFDQQSHNNLQILLLICIAQWV